MESPVWLITGVSNGLGLAFCLRALKAGHKVIGTMRNMKRAEDTVKAIEKAGGKIFEMDMTESQESIIQKIQSAQALHGRIDILVNNAGYSLLGPVSEFTEKEASTQIQTNVFGPLFAIQAVLPAMRARKSGTIVNISSIAGQNTTPTCGLYSASKAALECVSEALALEEAENGVSVLIVEPGGFRTNFLAAFVPNEKGIQSNGGEDSAVTKGMQRWRLSNGKQPGDPNKAVDRVFEVVMGEGMAGGLNGRILRLPLGSDCIARLDAVMERRKSDVDACREVASSTDF